MHSVCVIGLGRIGLPIACLLADAGYSVTGVDTDMQALQRPTIATEPGLQKLLKHVQLPLTREIPHADIYILALPTGLDSAGRPDISALEQVIDQLRVDENQLIIIESTLPIGTTERLSHRCSAQIAYCPERVLPGHILEELISADRLIGTLTEDAANQASEVYRSFSKGEILFTSARTAEAVKLVENTFRDINIAFANELSMIADSSSLNITEVIQLANRHPRVNILQPAVGVGGDCIPVSPHFLASSQPKSSTLMLTARKVNKTKTDWVLDRIRTAAKFYDSPTIACLGLTYKPDVPDLNGSAALAIVESLSNEFTLLASDPYVPTSTPLSNALCSADLIVVLVKHREYFNLPRSLTQGKILLNEENSFCDWNASRGTQARSRVASSCCV